MDTKAIYLLKKAKAALEEADALQQEAFDSMPESDSVNPNISYLIHNDIESSLDTIEEWVDALESSNENA